MQTMTINTGGISTIISMVRFLMAKKLRLY